MSESEEEIVGTKSLPSLRVLFGTSAASQELIRNLEVIAATDLSVVLRGEAGTGAELVARWVHSLSPYSGGCFVTANSWNMAPPDLGSEYQDRAVGLSIVERLENAGLATLFVENVESLESRAQASLARFLQDGNFPGDVRDPGSPAIGIRIISATQKDLKQEVTTGALRPDFFHCISAFTVRMPPLRSRLNELPELVSHFIQLHAKELGLAPQPLSRSALQVLQQYLWPGNLRELEEMLIGYVLTGSEELLLEKVSALQRSSQAAAGDLLEGVRAKETVSSTGTEGIQQLDNDSILRALRENGWNRRQTAHRLQISYRSLLYKLKKMDLASGHRSGYRVARLAR